MGSPSFRRRRGAGARAGLGEPHRARLDGERDTGCRHRGAAGDTRRRLVVAPPVAQAASKPPGSFIAPVKAVTAAKAEGQRQVTEGCPSPVSRLAALTTLSPQAGRGNNAAISLSPLAGRGSG